MQMTSQLTAGALLMVVGYSSAAQERPMLEVRERAVGRYEKAEFVIRLDADYERPYDPEQVDVALAVTTPSGARVSVPAFWRQGYERRRVPRDGREADWFYPEPQGRWLARYAPAEVGTHSATVRVVDAHGERISAPVGFECVPSDRPGFLRVSESDPRFLEFTDGTPFFAIGQNVAFIGTGQYVDLSGAEAMLARLSENGANFVRVWTCCEDWAMAVEARKSAWDRSWARNGHIVRAPDRNGAGTQRWCIQLAGGPGARVNVEPSHPVALRPSAAYRMTGSLRAEAPTTVTLSVGPRTLSIPLRGDGAWEPFAFEFETGADSWWLPPVSLSLQEGERAWLDDLSLREAAGGPELLWEADLNRPARGFYNPVDCFMLDELVEAANATNIRLMLCLFTRDLYMEELSDETSPDYDQAIADGRNLMRYAIARWGYSPSVAMWEYWNEMDPGKPTGRFYSELGEYIAQTDPYGRPRTTSAWASAPDDWAHPAIDVAQEHYYFRPSESRRLTDEVAAVIERAALVRTHAPTKPALLGEFGLATEEWRLAESMGRDTELVHFHNALWASALSGLSGTAMFWWWDQLDRMNAYRHYRPLADFMADVPFTTAGLRQSDAVASDRRVRTIGLQGAKCLYAWLLNEAATWTRLEAGAGPTEDLEGLTLQVGDLAPGEYVVEWWDTRGRGVLARETANVGPGVAELRVPAFRWDIACRVESR